MKVYDEVAMRRGSSAFSTTMLKYSSEARINEAYFSLRLAISLFAISSSSEAVLISFSSSATAVPGNPVPVGRGNSVKPFSARMR